jgi:hypothetical protein
MYSKCATCHRPGQVAPFPLLSYEDVAKRSALISQVVKSRAMPPWNPGPCDYSFQDDQSLSPQQIAAVLNWSASGMKKGSFSDLPPAPHFASSWRLGPPDLIVKMPKPFKVPADGPDIFRNFVVPLNLPKDEYICAIDFEPGNRSVVHHSLFYWDSSGTAKQNDGKDGQPGYDGSMGNILGGSGSDGGGAIRFGTSVSLGKAGNLGGWAVGAQAMKLPEGLAYSVPKGSDMILATHFHPSGKAEVEQSMVGLYFAKKPPTQEFTSLLLPPTFGYFSNIDIPAGKKDYVLTDSFTLPVDIKAFGVTAHAHFLGKHMTLSAKFPNGETKVLLDIPNWDFNWQGQYQYNQFIPLPKGTTLFSKITYDNSADNPSNPSNPPKRVEWGEQTVNEMGSLILSVVPSHPEDFKALRKGYRQHVAQVAQNSRNQ